MAFEKEQEYLDKINESVPANSTLSANVTFIVRVVVVYLMFEVSLWFFLFYIIIELITRIKFKEVKKCYKDYVDYIKSEALVLQTELSSVKQKLSKRKRDEADEYFVEAKKKAAELEKSSKSQLKALEAERKDFEEQKKLLLDELELAKTDVQKKMDEAVRKESESSSKVVEVEKERRMLISKIETLARDLAEGMTKIKLKELEGRMEAEMKEATERLSQEKAVVMAEDLARKKYSKVFGQVPITQQQHYDALEEIKNQQRLKNMRKTEDELEHKKRLSEMDEKLSQVKETAFNAKELVHDAKNKVFDAKEERYAARTMVDDLDKVFMEWKYQTANSLDSMRKDWELSNTHMRYEFREQFHTAQSYMREEFMKANFALESGLQRLGATIDTEVYRLETNIDRNEERRIGDMEKADLRLQLKIGDMRSDFTREIERMDKQQLQLVHNIESSFSEYGEKINQFRLDIQQLIIEGEKQKLSAETMYVNAQRLNEKYESQVLNDKLLLEDGIRQLSYTQKDMANMVLKEKSELESLAQHAFGAVKDLAYERQGVDYLYKMKENDIKLAESELQKTKSEVSMAKQLLEEKMQWYRKEKDYLDQVSEIERKYSGQLEAKDRAVQKLEADSLRRMIAQDSEAQQAQYTIMKLQDNEHVAKKRLEMANDQIRHIRSLPAGY